MYCSWQREKRTQKLPTREIPTRSFSLSNKLQYCFIVMPPPTTTKTTKSQQLLALAAKQALVCLGVLIVFLILTWPALVVLVLLLHYILQKKQQLEHYHDEVVFLDITTPIMSITTSSSVVVVILLCIITTHIHLNLLTKHPSYLCLNRRIFLPLRIPLPPLLMLIYRSEMLREGGSTWYRDTFLDAKLALRRLTRDERESLRYRLLRRRTSTYQEITQLLLQLLPKHGRRDLTKKIRQHYYPRKISSQSVLGEYDLSTQDFYLLFWGEGRKIQSDLSKKAKTKENDNNNNNSISRLSISTRLIIIDQFLQRALILLLCPNAIIDRYYDADGKYCAMTFSYRLVNATTIASADSSTSSNDGGVHLSIGYFSLPNESSSGIWHYNFLRCMLRGFISGLYHELELIPPTSSSSSKNNVRYVNMEHMKIMPSVVVERWGLIYVSISMLFQGFVRWDSSKRFIVMIMIEKVIMTCSSLVGCL